MNHCYKTVYNTSLGVWQAVSELARGQAKAGRGVSLALAATLGLACTGAWADSLTTTYAGGNSQNGNMFDISSAAAVHLTSLQVSLLNGGTTDYDIYYRLGTWVGSQSTASDWTLLQTGTVSGSASAASDVIDLTTPLSLAAGQTYSLYVVLPSAYLSYSNSSAVGDVGVTDGNLTVYVGAGSTYLFGATYTPRLWNGTLYYNSNLYWQGQSSSLWSDANWSTDQAGTSSSSLGSDEYVVFGGSGTQPINTVLDQDYSIANLDVTTAADVTIAGNNTLTLDSTASQAVNVESGAGKLTIAANLQLLGNANTFTVDNQAGMEVSGTIDSQIGLVKDGSGTLILSGDNSYSGGTTISAGTLQIGNGGTSGSISGDILDNAALVFDRTDDITYAGAISGSGSLTQNGAGRLTLTGDNSYSGGTTISAGTLQIGNGGTTGSLTGDIVNDAALVFDRSDDTTYAGAISGSGSLTQNGAGSLILSGDNSYSGGTTISAGTLQIGDGGTTGSLTGDIVNDAALVFDRSDDTTYAGAISGSGSLTQNGAGSLILSGDNSYSGGTTISAGTLQIGDGGTSGSLTGDILDNAALVFDRADAVTYAGAISGSGSLTQSGAGSLILTGDNSYSGGTTVSAGTLQIGNGGTTGSLTGDILDNAALVFDRSDTVTYNGTISGSGTLTQQGSGKLILEGVNTYSGTTTVAAGSLIVGGSSGSTASLSSDVDVQSGALLGGHGSIIGDVSVASGATLAPGNSIGTLSVDGDVTFDSGSVLAIEANPDGSSDRLEATGTVTLGGATLSVLGGAGNWSPTTQYSIIEAGSVSGTFGVLTSDLAFLTPTVTYTDTSATLNLTRNDIAFAEVADTRNQRAVANALDSGSGSLADAALSLNAAQARQAFDSLSGELYASARGAMLGDSYQIREALGEHLRNVPTGQAAGDELHHDAASGLTFWLRSYGNWSQHDGNHNVADIDNDNRGTLLGIELPLNDTWRAGLAAGYGTSDLNVHDRSSSADVDNTTLAAYLGGQWQAINLRLGVARTWSDVDSKRDVRVGDLSETLKAGYDATTTQAFGELGYRVQINDLSLEPFAGLAHVEVSSDGVHEHGGDAALSASSEKDRVDYASLGVRGETPLGRIANRPLDLRAGLAWQHALQTPDGDTRMTLAGYDSFTVQGVPVAQDTAQVQLGVSLQLAPQASVDLGYSGQFGSGTRDHGLRAGVSIAF